MKFFVLSIVALCAVASAEVDFLEQEIPNERDFSHHKGPYALNLALSEHESQQLEDQQLLEGYLGRSLIAETIQNVLEGFRDVVINGNESLPPLDPLVVGLIGPFESNVMTGVRASASIHNLRAEGLRWYVVDYVTFNALRLTLGAQVTLPWFTVTGTYDAQARILLLDHRAGGNFRVFINRLEVGVDVRLGTNLLAGHLILRDLVIRIDIADTQIQINGLTGSSLINTFINSYIQNLTQEMIQTHLAFIGEMISEEAFDTINDILKDYTLNDILG